LTLPSLFVFYGSAASPGDADAGNMQKTQARERHSAGRLMAISRKKAGKTLIFD
jgi:hypothetical protein